METDLKSITEEFHKLYYNSGVWAEGNTKFVGFPILKNPCDMWIYQEIIFEIRPKIIIETGTYCGGSALFMVYMMLLSKIQNPLVVTIDIQKYVDDLHNPHIVQVVGSSTDKAVLDLCKHRVGLWGDPIMVILDSDHKYDHVLSELELYAPLVSPGSYLIVEDTNINGHPVYEEHGSGPYEAVQDFLKTHDEFEVDLSREKFGLTFNPSGFLRKRK